MGGGTSKDAPRATTEGVEPRQLTLRALRTLDDSQLCDAFADLWDGSTAKGEPSMSRAALKQAMQRVHTGWSDADIADAVARADANADGQVTFAECTAAVRASSTLEMLLRSLHLECIVAGALTARAQAKHTDDAMALLLQLADDDIERALQDAVKPLARELQRVKQQALASQVVDCIAEGGKFAYELRGGSIEAFFGGVTDVVGAPRASIEDGMRREHCHTRDAEEAFTTGNYGVTTTPALEYAVATGEGVCEASGNAGLPTLIKSTRRAPAKDGKPQRDERRLRCAEDYGAFNADGTLASREVGPNDTDLQAMVKRAALTRAEVTALVLYTGPMFQVYNGILRGFGSCGAVAEGVGYATDGFWPQLASRTVADRVAASGNKYATTIHCLASAIKKLERVAECRQGERVYRGLGGGDWRGFARGAGFTERGFMSTTSDLQVALEYSGVKNGRVGCVLAMELSEVDRGADLSAFSQYPGEREMLWNACSYVENLRGREEVHMTQCGPVQMLIVKANANGRAQTVEELQARRKKIVKNMGDALYQDLSRMLDAKVADECFEERLAIDRKVVEFMGAGEDPTVHLDTLVGNIKRDVRQTVDTYDAYNAEYYNVNASFVAAVQSVAQLPRKVHAMVRAWVDNEQSPLELLLDKLPRIEDAERAHRQSVRRRYEAARGAGDAEALKCIAIELCVLRGWVQDEHSVDKADPRGERPLYKACADGNLAAVRALIDAGVDIQFNPDYDKISPLSAAVGSGNADVVDLLCNRGARLNFSDDVSVQPMWTAVSACDVDTMHVLVQHGAPMDVPAYIVVHGANLMGRSRAEALAFMKENHAPSLDEVPESFEMSPTIKEDEKEELRKVMNGDFSGLKLPWKREVAA